MPTTEDDQAEATGPGVGRVLAFSDGVFAIAITILVLNLEVPAELSTPELVTALRDLSPELFSAALSFAVIARCWLSHHAVLDHAAVADRPLLLLNTLVLAPLVLVPFTTVPGTRPAGRQGHKPDEPGRGHAVTAAPLAPEPVDVTANPHLQGLFAPVIEESDEADLDVVGALPADMDGLYLRNGPNPRFTPLGSYIYPLEGDGMVHGLWVRDGRARYANRFVRTPALEAEERAGRALWGGLMTGYLPPADEVGPKLAGTWKELPDINVVRHGGQLLALAESACPFRLSPELETLGRETFGGALPAGMTAHPKVDPLTGEMAVFCYALEPPFLTWAMIGPDGAATRRPTPVPGVEAPVMIHDMGLTRRYLVVVLAPLYFDMAAAMSGGSLLSWRPDDGTRIALIPRDGGPVRWAHSEAYWTWHTANAFDADDGPDSPVIVDYVQWARPGGLARGAGPNEGGLARAEIDPARGGIVRRWLAEPGSVEFPRIDDRRIGRVHSTIAVGATSGRHELIAGEHDALLWLDSRTGRSERWDGGELVVGEPVFVPKPGDADETSGWWGTFAIDRTDESSWFLVIPAAEPASGPVARVRVRTRVPLGLHGAWLPTEE